MTFKGYFIKVQSIKQSIKKFVRLLNSSKMVHLVFDALPVGKVVLDEDQKFTAVEIHQKASEHLEHLFGCGNYAFYLLYNGKLFQDGEIHEGKVHVIPRLLGGKGGFGSMLRAIGAQIEKTTNREACRDLSGRRLRDINEEKRLKKWIAEQAEREQEALERKKKKLEKLTQVVKHEFKDEEYTKARVEMPENIHESFEEGLKAATEVAKLEESKPAPGKPVEPSKARKRPNGKLWVDDLLDDIEESEEEESEESPSKRAKLS